MKNIALLFLFILLSFAANGQCNAPTNLHIFTDPYPIEVYVKWDTNDADSWDIEYGVSGFTPTGTPNINDYNQPYYPINNITNQTYIDFYVRTDCGSETSDWVGPFTFYNYCLEFTYGSFVNEYFNDAFIPDCWSESSQGSPDTGIETIGTSNWVQGAFANNPDNTQAAKITISGTNTHEWLVLPPLRGFYGCKREDYFLILKFDIALTQSGLTDAASLGTDDVIHLVISPDFGATWYPIKTWDVDATISNTGEHLELNYQNGLDGFDLFENVFLIAFWASSGSVDDGVSVDFFIDNMEALPPMAGAVDDLASKGFSFYPNPADDVIQLKAREKIDEITLYNQLGEKMLYQKIDKFYAPLELSGFPEGMYYMHVTIGDAKGVVPIILK